MREELEAVALGAGLSVGPSSLAGYVQEQSGAFSVLPTGVKRLRGSPWGCPTSLADEGAGVLFRSSR